MANPLESDLAEAGRRLEGAWAALDGAHVLVTGGSGFFGCWMLEALLWAIDAGRLRARVDVTMRDATAFGRKAPHLAGHPAVRLLPGDVRALTPGERYTHVVHLACTASTAQARDYPGEIADIMIQGTRAAIAAARPGRARFLLASAGKIYGPQPPEMTHVPDGYLGGPDAMDPIEIMSEAKRMAESLVAVAVRDEGLPGVVSRGFAFVGPYLPLDSHFAIGNFIRDAMAGRPIVVNGDGTPYRSYMYGADLAVWLWTMLVEGRPGRSYNTGSEAGLPLADVAARVGAIAGVPVTVAGTPIPGRPPQRYVPDTARARTELGLGMSVELDEAVRRTMAWHRHQA